MLDHTLNSIENKHGKFYSIITFYNFNFGRKLCFYKVKEGLDKRPGL